MATDWMKEFDKINIPYADCYVYENQTKKKITDANEKFNKYYTKCVRQSEIKLKFVDEVKVFYLEQQLDENDT